LSCYHLPMSKPDHPDRHSRAARRIATTFGLGEILPAPGTTAGSLPAALVWAALATTLPSARLLLTVTGGLTIAAVIMGVWAAGKEASRRGAEDPGPVVIDEVAGQWLCYLTALPFIPLDVGPAPLFVTAAGFFLFRLFDVWKPWPIRSLEQLPGGIGIVADDLAAGLLAGIVLAAGWRVIVG